MRESVENAIGSDRIARVENVGMEKAGVDCKGENAGENCMEHQTEIILRKS